MGGLCRDGHIYAILWDHFNPLGVEGIHICARAAWKAYIYAHVRLALSAEGIYMRYHSHLYYGSSPLTFARIAALLRTMSTICTRPHYVYIAALRINTADVQLEIPRHTTVFTDSTQCKPIVRMQGDMATRAILTLSEVIEEVQNDDSDGEMSDGGEDDFEGYNEDETCMERQQEDERGQNSHDEELTGEEQQGNGEESE